MAEEPKKFVAKPRARTDLGHARYAGIEWCQHEINREYCKTCKEADAKTAAAKLAKQTKKIKIVKAEPEEVKTDVN